MNERDDGGDGTELDEMCPCKCCTPASRLFQRIEWLL